MIYSFEIIPCLYLCQNMHKFIFIFHTPYQPWGFSLKFERFGQNIWNIYLSATKLSFIFKFKGEPCLIIGYILHKHSRDWQLHTTKTKQRTSWFSLFWLCVATNASNMANKMSSIFNISTEENALSFQQNKWNDLARKRFTIHSFATICMTKTPPKPLLYKMRYKIPFAQ